MKTRNGKMQLSVLAFAVQGALLAMYATPVRADDAEAAALMTPSNYIQFGAVNTSSSSAKFGEYNGLNKMGADPVINFNIRGGDAYGDGDGTKRWAFTGSDVGLSSRALGASVSNQGQWSLGVGYDELSHNVSDTYQTPYLGSMGGSSFTMPAGFGTVSTAAAGTAPTGTDALTAAQKAAFHTMDISSIRKNGSISAGVNLNAQWDVKFDFNHLEQSGAKLMAFGSMANLGAAPTVLGEVVSVLPNPTNYTTDTINLALNWVGEKAHMSTSYFGSFFRDNYNGVNFQTFGASAAPAGVSMMQTMSTAPNNDFHQLNLKGGYDFSSKTKLIGGFSYGLNTQNDSYAVDSISMAGALPQGSLGGMVRNTHVDLRLIDQTTKDLALSAGVKVDERFNQTASNFYYFNALDGANLSPPNPTSDHRAYFPNTPYSNRKTQAELAGDYRLTKDQHVRLAYNRENIKRWCDQYAVGGLGTVTTALSATAVATTAISSFPAGTDCVVAPGSQDDKLSATYKLRASEDLNLNMGYSYSKRVTTSDPYAITARLGTNGNANPAPTTGLTMGLNGGDYVGFYPAFDASRTEQTVKAGANWQASEKMSLEMVGRYTGINFGDSTYGVQQGNSWSVNLDANYSYSENASVFMYLTQQHRERDLTDLQRSPYLAAAAPTATAIGIPSGATWTDKLKDNQTTLGIGAKQRGLMGSRLELAEDLTYSLGQTDYGTLLNYATTTTGGLTCSDPHILSCGDLPTIRNQMMQFKLTGKYQIDKNALVGMGYMFQQLESSDYYYNGLQTGYTANSMMPTNQQSGSYIVHVVAVSYSHNF